MEDKEVHTFPKDISPNVNEAQPEFELIHYDITDSMLTTTQQGFTAPLLIIAQWQYRGFNKKQLVVKRVDLSLIPGRKKKEAIMV